MTDQNSYQELSKLLGAPTSKILPRIIEKITDEKEIKILLAAFPAATVPELSNETRSYGLGIFPIINPPSGGL